MPETKIECILLDRFVSGLRQSLILDRLCDGDEEKLTLQQAVDIAVTKESSVKDSYIDGDDCDEPNDSAGRNKPKYDRRRGGHRNKRAPYNPPTN